MAQQIESKDIKLYASEKLNDAPDGGGRVTANEIESGQINNVFQDISRVDHANGSVELRKLFMGIRTQNNAPLLGSHMLVIEPPQDDNVTTLIFQTPKDGREIDQRTAARDYLETYYVKSSREFMQPLGLNLEASNIISFFAPAQVPVTTKSGDTVVLYDSTTQLEEYVKISSLDVTNQTFIYIVQTSGEYRTFNGKLIRCQLVSPLRNTWDGGEARPNGVTNDKLSVYSTAITSAARYRGATKLTEQLEDGEVLAKVASVLQPIVPVARQEQALVNQSPYQDTSPVIRGTDADASPLIIEVTPTEESGVVYMPTAVTRASMTLQTDASSWAENGAGELVQNTGAMTASVSVDYATGIVTHSGFKNIKMTFRYLPAAAASMPAVTTGLEITQANLGLVYTFDLSGLKPEPNTLFIEYMSTDDWFDMNDDGQGLIVGQGGGTVDYTTGQVQVTLQREPEIGSYILLSYVPTKEMLFDRPSGSNQLENIQYQREVLFNGPVKPGTLVIKNEAGDKQSVDDSAGNFTGAAGEGTIEYATGKITFFPQATAHETTYEVTAETSTAGTHSASVAVTYGSGGSLTLSLGQAYVAGTLSLRVPVEDRVKREASKNLLSAGVNETTVSRAKRIFLRDDANGNVIDTYGAVVGTINYTTGAISLPSFLKQDSYQNIENIGGAPRAVQYTEYQRVSSDKAEAHFIYASTGYTATTKTLTIAGAKLKITDIYKYEPIAPKSLWLKIAGVDYLDDGNGKIITGYSAATGSGTQVGNIDYYSGQLDIQNVSVTAQDVDVKSLVVLKQGLTSEQLLFAIKDRPLRHASFQMNAETLNGTIKRYEADENGEINVVAGGTGKIGTINIQTGVVIINTATLGGSLQEKASVLGSLRYNAVKSVSLPVDPDIVGLNVQRLPIDGRVPIFKLGDTVVLNHVATQAISTPTASATINLDRDHLAEAIVLCGKTELDRTQYEVDLEAGTITFSNELVLQDAQLNPLSGDWTVNHRIEHMSLATRVQQNGTITLQVASAHTFPIGTTVSSALLFGDLQADVLNMYSQKTWQNNEPNWTDQPDSSGETTARYDTINYPIAVSNYSAVTDKWALIFRNSNTVDVVSENLGVIATSVSIANTIAPINPVTEQPYFVMQANGWGGGWATGNAIRFNTQSALAPFWIARTVTPSQGITESDSLTISPRGDSQ